MHITIPILLLLLPLASASSLTLALHNTPTCARLDPIAPRTIEIDTWTCYNITNAAGLEIVKHSEDTVIAMYTFNGKSCPPGNMGRSWGIEDGKCRVVGEVRSVMVSGIA